MKRSLPILFIVFTLALIQLTCSRLSVSSSGGGIRRTFAPLFDNMEWVTDTPRPSPTRNPPAPTATASPMATIEKAGGNGRMEVTCTYQATFISDVTIPDDTLVTAGDTFVKTWRVRNDGTCTWGPDGYALNALAFTGGSQMGAPALIPLHTTVTSGETVEVSVTLTAPTTPGTYTSSWMFRIDNDPNGVGPNLGLGLNGDQPLYALIRVDDSLTRLQFEPGTTTRVMTGSLEANGTRGYQVAAQQDQVIIAGTALDDWEGGVRVKVTTSDNAVLPELAGNLSFVATLPETGDYIVWVSGGSNASSYQLAVTIPIRINFDPGAVSASMDGSIHNGREISYVFHAYAGQTLTTSLDGSNVSLIVTSLENQQILSAATSNWTGFLPNTQDYIIQVMPAVESTSYTLHVTIQ